MRVGIVGLGVIGKAQARMFAGHDLVTYDPAENDVYPPAMAGCDLIILCVGTPQGDDGHANLAYVEEAVEALPPNVPVVLRSTVPPGTTDRLLNDTGRLYCHAPEFMGENPLHSWQEPSDVPYLLLGGSGAATRFFASAFRQTFPGVIHRCSAMESELAKYTANLYWATRVTFINEIGRVCDRFGVDYEHVRAAWLNDPRMTSEYTQLEGYDPGFGGRCWPKDLAALIAASEDIGYEPGFLKAIEASNERFRSSLQCVRGHQTTERRPGQHQLPCGCVLETATAEALEAEFGRAA